TTTTPNNQPHQTNTPSNTHNHPNNHPTTKPTNKTNTPNNTTTNNHTNPPTTKHNNPKNHTHPNHNPNTPNNHKTQTNIRPENTDLHKKKPEHLDTPHWTQDTAKKIAPLSSLTIHPTKLANNHTAKTPTPKTHRHLHNITPPPQDEHAPTNRHENKP
ncbi:hypothetical protein ACTHT6_11585, partial [Neisseria sp. P0022.S006]